MFYVALGMNALILNGGESRRMGTPKGNLCFMDDPEVIRLIDLLSPLCSQVFLSMKNTEYHYPVPVILDKYPIHGPLNGIASALLHHVPQSWLVVPCDMPFTDEPLISFLLKERNLKANFTGFYDSTGKQPEPLIGIWEASIIPALGSYIANGESVRHFLKTQPCHFLHIPDEKYHTNINTPVDLDRFRGKKR